MNAFEQDPGRVWRQDRGAIAAGVCAGLAEDLDLPLTVVRVVSLLFLLLPTGLAYLALALILRRRPQARPFRMTFAARFRDAAASPGRATSGRAGPAMPTGQAWALLQHRFEQLEPRLGRIETFVSADDFELHRDFGRMGR